MTAFHGCFYPRFPLLAFSKLFTPLTLRPAELLFHERLEPKRICVRIYECTICMILPAALPAGLRNPQSAIGALGWWWEGCFVPPACPHAACCRACGAGVAGAHYRFN